MKKVLITTDFSANSKAGLRFAIQLASQMPCELTFFHSYHIMKPVSWAELTFDRYEESEALKIKKQLESFVLNVYKSIGVLPGKLKCVIKSSFVTDSNIMKYASDNQFDFICISRRGGGKMHKVFGTNTSNLILQSSVPVIAVPNTYRRSRIESILYASDMANLDKEIKQVIDFAKPLKAHVELLHLDYPSVVDYNAQIIESTLKKFPRMGIKFRIEKINLLYNLVSNIEMVIKKNKPSMMIMFTEQNQSFFEKLFLSSSSAEYALKSSVPLLVFGKNGA